MMRILPLVCALSHVHCTSIVERFHVHEGDDFVFDWRTKGVISPVYKPSPEPNPPRIVITEEIESMHAIQNKIPVVELSQAEMTDCCPDRGIFGVQDFKCPERLGGLCAATDYRGGTGHCNNASCTPVGKVTGGVSIPSACEDLMVQAIHLVPLAVAVDASQDSFMSYTSGIYSDTACSQTTLDHELQLVGYGRQGGIDYWIAKNSWGTEWGEQGYIRLLRGNNTCGVATQPFYPVNNP